MGIEAGIAIAGLAVSAIGAGVSAYGSYEQGQQEQQMANYNAAIQRNNAQVNSYIQQQQVSAQQNLYSYQEQSIQQQQAANMAQAREQIARESEQKAQLQAHQRAAYAGAGVVLEGTPLAVLSDTEKKYQLMQADTLYQAQMKNYSLQNEFNTADYQKGLLNLDIYGAQQGLKIANSQADLTQMQGSAAATAGKYNAVGTLLSSAASGMKTGFQDYQYGAL